MNRKQSKRQFIKHIPDVPVHMPMFYDISCVQIPDISATKIDISRRTLDISCVANTKKK